jgi:hypothetical protein
MSWIADSPESYAGQKVHNGQCVRFCQQCAGMPHTSHWRRGRKVRGGDVAPGTAIATFDDDGRYGNHTDGRSHAAILIAEIENGLRVWDQWRGHPVSQRTIGFRGGHGKKVNDGDAFSVVIGETESA